MAAVGINTGVTSATPLAEVPRREWPDVLELRRMFCRRSLPGDCRLLLHFIDDGRQSGFGGYPDEEAYVRDGLGLDPKAVAWAIKGLKLTGSDVPVPFDDAVRKGAAQIMAEAKPLAKHGEIGRGRDRGSNRTSNTRGETAAYLAARIKRERPDIAEAVERGEYRSIRAAAIAAAIVKQQTPLERIYKLLPKLSQNELEQLAAEVDRRKGRRR
jgi:hypothetical protein